MESFSAGSEEFLDTFLECIGDTEEYRQILLYRQTVENLIALRTTIEKFGLTPSLLAFADFDGVLSNHIEQIPSLESYLSRPEQFNLEEALEGIGQNIKNVVSGWYNAVNRHIDKYKSFYVAIIAFVTGCVIAITGYKRFIESKNVRDINDAHSSSLNELRDKLNKAMKEYSDLYQNFKMQTHNASLLKKNLQDKQDMLDKQADSMNQMQQNIKFSREVIDKYKSDLAASQEVINKFKIDTNELTGIIDQMEKKQWDQSSPALKNVLLSVLNTCENNSKKCAEKIDYQNKQYKYTQEKVNHLIRQVVDDPSGKELKSLSGKPWYGTGMNPIKGIEFEMKPLKHYKQHAIDTLKAARINRRVAKFIKEMYES